MTDTLNRPDTLDAMIGQEDTLARLRITFAGSIARGVKPPHVLLAGPAGHGKTTLARIIAQETGANLITTTGPTLRKPGDLAGILAGIDAGTVLFIDEIHRLTPIVEETLYEVLEDNTLSVVVGNGPAAKAVTLRFPPIIVVGATTMPGKLTTPLRDRFGLSLTVAPYSDAELAKIVERSWDHAEIRYAEGSAEVVAQRSKGVPRLALHLASRVLDVAALEKTSVTPLLTERALEAFGVGAGGLDEQDRAILEALCVTFAGRPVGLANLAQAVNMDTKTIEEAHEPNLVRAGLVIRTAQGRLATELAHEWRDAHK